MVTIADPQLRVEPLEGHPGERRLVVTYSLHVPPFDDDLGATLSEDVIVTAYDEHALAAFEANAIDYLLKPVRPERLLRALAKARVLSSEQQLALEQWLRQVPDDPAGLLRRKFMLEHLLRQKRTQSP